MDTNVKILVCCHKDDIIASQPPYMPIHVGKALSSLDLGMQGDDTGENISEKNASYCELTGMYWAWRNLKGVDVIGLCHYRRYFDFHNQCRWLMPHDEFTPDKLHSFDLSIPGNVTKSVIEGRVVVAKPLHYMYKLAMNYYALYVSDDFRTLEQVIAETQGKEIVDAFHTVMHRNNTFMPYNMFVMSWSDFDEYCRWLFPLLQEIESRIDISHYNSFQRRIFGFMAERLFNVWLYARKRGKLVCKPIIKLCDEPINHNWLAYQCATLYRNAVMAFSVFETTR